MPYFLALKFSKRWGWGVGGFENLPPKWKTERHLSK